jgi:malate-CoA ligase subunit alpha
VREAVAATGADASLLFVPPPMAADAMMEAAEAGIKYRRLRDRRAAGAGHDEGKRFLRRYPREKKMRLIGPNCAGIISPGKGFMGIMPPHIYMPGRVGIVGRSGTLGYEAASQMQALGIGVSSSIGIGG